MTGTETAKVPLKSARAREDSRAENRDGEGRRRRVPLGTPTQRLQAPRRNGYHRRWINDIPGRIEQARGGGYEHVMERGGGERKRSAVVGKNPDGSPLTAYLMEIPQKFYDEDQQAKQREIDKTDETIQRGNIRGADPKDRENFYVPTEGISVRSD